ncbi:MAG: hypothetical protein BGO49_14460 [Planctomycetales bacterium 71-10]|nr:MAG: hypothetical protein BGO49_14460 [Planctomycetales bacterium 71-10]
MTDFADKSVEAPISQVQLDESLAGTDHILQRIDVTSFGLVNFVQRLLSLLIVGLLLMCPLLCQAAQMDRCVGGEKCSSTPCEDDQGPVPCPDDGVSCICAGAVQTTDLRAVDFTPDLLPCLNGWLFTALVHPIPLLSQSGLLDGVPPDWAPWGHPLRVHALTQHFRC